MQIVSPATSLYFAGKEQQIKYEAVITSPANIPVRINAHIILWGGTVEIKRSLPPVKSGASEYKATFDITRVLYSELFRVPTSLVFSFPGDPDTPVLERKDYLLRDFYVDVSYDYVDTNGDIKEDGRSDNSAQKYYAIQGGISRVFRYYLQNEDISFFEWLNAKDTQLRFLSWIPNNLPVHPSQPVRLWFYNDNKLDTANLKLKVKFTDGTESGVLSRSGINASSVLLEVACGPLEMRLSTIDISKTVASYQIWLENSDGSVKSEVKTFVLDYTSYERNDVLFFKNSLGVNEVLWCHGRRKEKIKTNTEERTQPLAENAIGEGTIRAYRSKLEYPFEMNTGWFPKSMRHYLADFLNSSEAKLPVKFYYMPVVIKPGTFNWGEDGKDLFSLSFKIQVAHSEDYYSPVPDVESPWGDFNNDFNEDFF